MEIQETPSYAVKSTIPTMSAEGVMKEAAKEVLPGIQIVPREKSEAEILLEKEIETYYEFLNKVVDGFDQRSYKDYNSIELFNSHYGLIDDYFKKTNASNRHRFVTLDGLEEILVQKKVLKHTDFVHAVMPFDDAKRVIGVLSDYPSLADTKVIVGAHGTIGDGNESYAKVLMDLMMANFDGFCGYEEMKDGKTYCKVVYSDYKKNLSKRHN